jgi:hypothetical protein
MPKAISTISSTRHSKRIHDRSQFNHEPKHSESVWFCLILFELDVQLHAAFVAYASLVSFAPPCGSLAPVAAAPTPSSSRRVLSPHNSSVSTRFDSFRLVSRLLNFKQFHHVPPCSTVFHLAAVWSFHNIGQVIGHISRYVIYIYICHIYVILWM